MKSFSPSASPVILSASSSQISLNTSSNPPIYECLEKLTEPTLYRSRLNSALSNKGEEEPHYHAPQQLMQKRTTPSPRVEKVQYASLMKELQNAIVCKKEPSSVSPPSKSDSEKTTSKSSSRHESSRSGKSSDVEFSKELEAALQLIQDLESPNTIETPSEPKSSIDGKESQPLAVWQDASESEKTLSAVGSLAEIASPIECQAELYTFKPAHGKSAAVVVVNSNSQSTSGYSSPTHKSDTHTLTPNWSTTSSVSDTGNSDPSTGYSIHNTKSTAVISLYSHDNPQSKYKSVSLVTISGNNDTVSKNKKQIPYPDIATAKESYVSSPVPKTESGVWNVKSLLRKKTPIPQLCPELEGAIIKSESLAYLTERELLARHQRNTNIRRVRLRAGADKEDLCRNT